VISNPSIMDAITSEDVLGKDVIDAKGAFLGVTDKLYLNPKSMRITGISIDKGFLKKGFIIGSGYIREISEHAVFLNIEPAFQIKGMNVFDKDGAKVGRIDSITLEGDLNSVEEIVVKTSSVGGKKIVIPAASISRIENSAFLNVRREELIASADTSK
jgi:sporulation protein YlmC with PRC-barrel domain